MYKLFYYPRNASWAPHMVLEELGVSYRLELVDRASNAQKSEAYLRLNPTGRIPTLVHDDCVIFESAAICLYLCDKHPEGNLIPPSDTKSRVLFNQWLFYLTSTLQSELMVFFYPDKHTTDSSVAASIKKAQELRITDMFRYLNNELEGKTFLAGGDFSVCDCYLFMLSHWAREFVYPPTSFEHLKEYLQRLAQRPSIATVSAAEGTDLGMYL